MHGLTQSVTMDRRVRLLRLGALIAAALMLSLVFSSTSARAAESDPTIVLVHGAFASPEGWSKVANALHKDGYQTATPALGLASVSDDVAIVQATLDSIPGDKILVGHSYGGFVITNAASGRTDVRGLVYTAAYVPDTDETINSLEVGYTPGTFLSHLVLAPSFPFGTPSGPGAWRALPSWYAISGADRAIDPDLQRFMAQRAGSTTVEFPAASHVGGLTHYSTRFVKLIEQAIDATAT